jgi:parvulin-like peptidyl-prolyl isomerase
MLTKFTLVLRTTLVGLVFGFSAVAGGQEPAAQPSGSQPRSDQQVVISVGELKITAADIDRFLESLPPQFRAYYGGPGRQMLPRYVVQAKILAAEAKKQNLQDRPEVQQTIEIARESILADAARKGMEQKVPVTDQEVQELYEKQKSAYDEVRIRGILIRTANSSIAYPAAPSRAALPEAEARKKLEDLRKQIQGGADFAQLARQYSEDLNTAGAGGDLGYINRQKVVPPIANAAYALAPGEVSDIIQSPYGLELIKVEDHRVKPLAEVRKDLEAQIRRTKVDQAIQELVSQYKVVVDNDYFSSSPPTKAPAVPSPH